MTGPAVVSTENLTSTNTTEQQASNDPFAEERERVRAEARHAALAEASGLYQGIIADNERARLALEARLNSTQHNAPTLTPDDPSAFLQNPQSEVRGIIQKELNSAIAPLNNFMMNFQKQEAYQNAKAQIRVHPHLSNVLPQVEVYLDQQYKNLNQIDPGAIAGLMMTILGQINAGFLQPLINMNPANLPQNSNRALPNPSPTSSPPVQQRTVPTAPTREPTENERKVMALHGFTDFAEYLKFMDVN